MADFLVTTTLYHDATTRFKLAQRTIQTAQALGCHMVIVDGSPQVFCDSFRGNHIHLDRGAYLEMGPSRRKAFFNARELALQLLPEESYFLWLEPEKVDLLRFIDQILAPLKSGQADIVIPKRSERSWVTYPEFQTDTEQQLNQAYEQATSLLGFDGAFGPVAFSTRVAKYFIDMCPKMYDNELDDGYIQLMAPIVAKHDGCTIDSVEVDFKYPPEQRVEEEAADNDTMRDKRRAQLEMNGRSFLRIAEVLRNIS